MSPRPRLAFWLLTALTASFCLFVLSLPLFPTEDGPIHLYFTTILGDLFTHHSPLYAQYFTIHHILPPYSLHYYLLLFLMKFFTAPMADKLFVCLILINFAYGFRYLATAIGPAGDTISLLIVALLFNWPLGMGFENFSLALGFACWALGIWARLQQPQPPATLAPRITPRIIFVALLALMTLTHPIPVILTLGFAALDMALHFVARLLWKSGNTLRPANIVTYFAGALTLGYIYLFTDKARSVQEVRAHSMPLAELVHYAQLFGLAFFGGPSRGVLLYHLALYAVFFFALILGAVAFFTQQRRQWTTQRSWFVAALLFLVAQPFFPQDMNGSHLFAERLLVFIWIAFLASASGASRLPRACQLAIAAFAIVVTVGVLGLARDYLAPVARQLAGVERSDIGPAGRIGLLLPGNIHDAYNFDDQLRDYPFTWAGARYFRQTNSILLNTPWMDLPILPITATPKLLTNNFPSTHLEDSLRLYADLAHSAAARAQVFPRIDFIFFFDPRHTTTPADLAQILNADPAWHWSCTSHDWYFLCNKEELSSQP